MAASADALICESLRQVELRDVTIESATAIASSPVWTTPQDSISRGAVSVTQPFCRVTGRIEREIEFEVWLPPASTWNGKYLGNGNGGYAGFINYGALAHGLQRGYATGSTDTGHKGSPMDASWAAGHPQRIEDYGHRAQHLMAVVARQLVERHYAKPPKYTYFMGCSNGGYQGLTEAQRYPDDYDGIVAGAPGTSFIDMSTSVLANGLRNRTDSPGYLAQRDMEFAVEKMTESCDAQDGVRDGLIENPLSCSFDYASIECRGEGAVQCLRPAQIATLKALYAPFFDSRGREIYPPPAFGTLLPVSELERRGKLGADMYAYLVYQDPTWNPASFDLDRDYAQAQARLSSVLVSSNADLRPFARRGGRLILYHGWSDSGPSPLNSIRYFEQVQQKVGRDDTDDFFRLFMVPGMHHCRGGPGPDSFGNAGDPPVKDARHDVLMALERWVEQGIAPDLLIASTLTEQRVTRTRPLCPYPAQARYSGSGDTDRAESFTCIAAPAGTSK
jgi:feruloyl esterase